MLKSEVGGSEYSTSENPPKRIKMESGTSTSSSPEGKNVSPQRKIINKDTHDFADVKEMLGFVDHTLFIRNFLSKETANRVAIFAPRRFGKSTQLNMLKLFLSCVDKSTGKPYANVDKFENRKIYKLFKDTKIGTDRSCRDILTEHLGKHPVIHVHLKIGEPICNKQDAENRVRIAVSDAYQEHQYLIDSLKLNPHNSNLNAAAQRRCENWCSVHKCEKEKLSPALENLAEYLYNHFDGTKVYFLVDEYDSITASAIENVEGNLEDKFKQMRQIAGVVVASICELVKTEVPYVGGVLITGVSFISGFGISNSINNLTTLRFLERNEVLPRREGFVPFYGATDVEVKNLVKKLVQDNELVNFKEDENFLNKQFTLDVEKIMLDIKSRYNGYMDEEGTPIFCLWSVLQYLETGEPEHFWNQTDGLGPFSNIFRSKDVAGDVLKLMQGKTISLERLDKLEIKQLLKLQELINETTKEVDYTVFFNYLKDLGYLSYAEVRKRGQTMKKFKMPNSEIRAAFSKKLLPVLKEWKFDIQSCAKVIDELFEHHGDQKALQEQMLAIHKELSNNLKNFKDKSPDIVNEARMLGALYGTMGQLKKFEFAVDSHIKLDGKTLSKGRPDYLLLDETNKFCILWELKHNKDEKEYKTSKYALEEARGNAPTKNASQHKDYMMVIEDRKLDALVIGLSLNGNCKTSISYSSNDEKKIFCITENEKNLYPTYYSDCIMLSEQKSDNENATE